MFSCLWRTQSIILLLTALVADSQNYPGRGGSNGVYQGVRPVQPPANGYNVQTNGQYSNGLNGAYQQPGGQPPQQPRYPQQAPTFGQNGNGLHGQQQPQQQWPYVQPTPKPPPLLAPNVNQPQKLAGTDGAFSTNGAVVTVQLMSYSNPTLALSNDTTCACQKQHCSFLMDTNQNACKFAFVTIISAPDQSVQFHSTEFMFFNGQLDGRSNSNNNWSLPMTFELSSKPVAIDIFVYHMGVVIDSTDLSLLYYDRLRLVDSFVISLIDYEPIEGAQSRSGAFSGKKLSTQLGVTYGARCINGRMGKACDLNCGVDAPSSSAAAGSVSSSSGNSAGRFDSSNGGLCVNAFGNYSQCNFNAGHTQVSSCIPCVNGVSSNLTCLPYLQDPEDVGVSYAFRTWTIVLGSLLGLAVIIILCLILAYIITRNRERDADQKATPYSPVARAQTRPLLAEEWTAPPPPAARRHPMNPPASAPTDGDFSRASDESFRNGHVPGTRQEHQV